MALLNMSFRWRGRRAGLCRPVCLWVRRWLPWPDEHQDRLAGCPFGDVGVLEDEERAILAAGFRCEHVALFLEGRRSWTGWVAVPGPHLDLGRRAWRAVAILLE